MYTAKFKPIHLHVGWGRLVTLALFSSLSHPQEWASEIILISVGPHTKTTSFSLHRIACKGWLANCYVITRVYELENIGLLELLVKHFGVRLELNFFVVNNCTTDDKRDANFL